MASLDPQHATFALLALGGFAAVLKAVGGIRDELQRQLFQTDDFRGRVTGIGDEQHKSEGFRFWVKGIVEECLAPLKARVKALESLSRIPETTAIPRERLDA